MKNKIKEIEKAQDEYHKKFGYGKYYEHTKREEQVFGKDWKKLKEEIVKDE